MIMAKSYNKEVIEKEALKSVEQDRMTDKLGQFVLMITEEISYMFARGGMEPQLMQELRDAAVMRVCENFFRYYDPNRKGNSSAANLIIGMVHDAMKRRVDATKWTDLYGQLNKEFIPIIDDEGNAKFKLIQSTKDDSISRLLSGEHLNELL